MPKVITFLNDNTVQNLKELSKISGKSLSKVTSELIEIGYQTKQQQEAQKLNLHDDKNTNISLKHMEYFLRILNIDSEILRKLYKEPSHCTGTTSDSILAEIKTHAQKQVEKNWKH